VILNLPSIIQSFDFQKKYNNQNIGEKIIYNHNHVPLTNNASQRAMTNIQNTQTINILKITLNHKSKIVFVAETSSLNNSVVL
jgi:hypothetical protein